MDGASERPCSRLRRVWVVIENPRNRHDELATLYENMAMARARIEQALEELASAHGIKASRVSNAMETYADNLLSALVSELKRQLTWEL
jgi:hypothetical protein